MDNIWIYGQALKVWSLVNVGLWNVPIGLWNSEDGLCNLDCETWRLDCETCRTDCETLKRGCETGIVKLWREIVKLWGEVVTLVLRNPELVQIRKSRSSKLHNQSPKFQNPTAKFQNSMVTNAYNSWNSLPCCSGLEPFFCRVPRGWEFWYHLTLVDNPSQFEVPRGLEAWYHLTLADNPSPFEVPWGGILISSYPWGQAVSISISIGGGNFDIILPLWTLQVSLKFHEGGNFDTSSTAHCGGGSFKNRKPIGEVGCCESGMAGRSHWWTERCLISLSLFFLFLSFSFCLSIILWLSTYLPTDLSVDLSIYLSVYLSPYVFI